MAICEKLVNNVQIFRRKSNLHNAIHENGLQQYSPIQQSIWGKNLVKLQHSQMILPWLNYSGWWPYLWNVTTSNEIFLTKGNILSLELLNTFSIFSLYLVYQGEGGPRIENCQTFSSSIKLANFYFAIGSCRVKFQKMYVYSQCPPFILREIHQMGEHETPCQRRYVREPFKNVLAEFVR